MSTHLGLSDGTSSYSEPESGNRFFFPNMPVSEIYLCSLVTKRRKQRELPRAQSHSILYSGIIGPCRNLRSFYIKTVIPSEKWWCPIICGLLYIKNGRDPNSHVLDLWVVQVETEPCVPLPKLILLLIFIFCYLCIHF